MILADSSVWIDHLRAADESLTELLNEGKVLMHAFVIGELALGTFQRRDAFLRDLRKLPGAPVATDEEVLHLIERHRLFGMGIGYVDAHLLASAQLGNDVGLWTRDRRLAEAAGRIGVAARLPH